jgi:NAD(P)-dependent dehydrogenase (short-subunit alcohol dehydrogenase family)
MTDTPAVIPSAERPLVGRTALVTGAAKRIGRVLALALAHAGANVAIHYHGSQTDALGVAADVVKAGAQAALVRGELSDPAVAEGLIAEVEKVLAPVDILVNNASIFANISLADTDQRVWDENQAINLRAPFLLSRAFALALPADRRGDIVNLNDWRALRPGADHFAYTVSKVGLHGLTRSMAVALAPRIKVNEIALGAVLPPERASADYVHQLKRKIPLDRWSTPEDVAEAMLFLITNGAVTGQSILIDGGRHLV